MTDPEATGAEVTIRDFGMEDYDEVMALWAESRLPLKPQGRDGRENIRRQIAQPCVIFLVAESSGRLVGTVLATHDARKGWINRLAVSPEFRRRGLGRRLVCEAEARLAAVGLEIFACLIEDWNVLSMDVFAKLGYTKHPEILYFTKRKFPEV
jgi:ribosomal protein S18 acetylase RimI-like enzyme